MFAGAVPSRLNILALTNKQVSTQQNLQMCQVNMDQVEQFHDYSIFLSQRLGQQTQNVYLCKNNENQQFYACKKVKFVSKNDLANFIHIISTVVGNNVCKLYFNGICKDHLYIITEYCPQGERNLEKFYIFTVSTASPQVLYGDLNKCSYKADIYSLGVLLYQMTNNLQLPNQYKSQNEIDYFHLRNQNQGIEKTLQFQSLTDERVQNLIFQMMQYKEDDRISIEELVIKTQQIAYNQQQNFRLR
ncbi:hypothetical protein ABPG74_009914 [Tetrahymena malaccensis]